LFKNSVINVEWLKRALKEHTTHNLSFKHIISVYQN